MPYFAAHTTGDVALEHAILVSLTEQSGSGYDLARRFDKSIGFFWSATTSRSTGSSSGWTRPAGSMARSSTQDGRPDKKVYRAQRRRPRRADALDRRAAPNPATCAASWPSRSAPRAHGDLAALATRSPGTATRTPSAWTLPADREARLPRIPQPLSGTALHQYLVLRGGIRVEEGFTDWCQEVLDALDADQLPSTAQP